MTAHWLFALGTNLAHTSESALYEEVTSNFTLGICFFKIFKTAAARWAGKVLSIPGLVWLLNPEILTVPLSSGAFFVITASWLGVIFALSKGKLTAK